MWKLNSALVLQLAAAAANQKTDPDVDIKSPYPSDGSSNDSSILIKYIVMLSAISVFLVVCLPCFNLGTVPNLFNEKYTKDLESSWPGWKQAMHISSPTYDNTGDILTQNTPYWSWDAWNGVNGAKGEKDLQSCRVRTACGGDKKYLGDLCPEKICVIPEGACAVVEKDYDYDSIVVHGSLEFEFDCHDKTIKLKTGHLVAEVCGQISIGSEEQPLSIHQNAIIYLKDVRDGSGVQQGHPHLGHRVFGAIGTQDMRLGYKPVVSLHGFNRGDSWAPLVENTEADASSVIVEGDVSQWQVGDRVVVSGSMDTMDSGACYPQNNPDQNLEAWQYGCGQLSLAFKIKTVTPVEGQEGRFTISFSEENVDAHVETVDNGAPIMFQGFRLKKERYSSSQSKLGTPAVTSGKIPWALQNLDPLGQPLIYNIIQNMERNILITGDPMSLAVQETYENADGPYACRHFGDEGTGCIEGLHTMFSNSTKVDMHHVKIEKAGQEGLIGKYALHLHQNRDSPETHISGIAIEHSIQRGVVVHG